MTKNIAIIGAGQLGSRHLQGLKLAKLPMNIYVVDSSQESLEVAKSRYEEVAENTKIEHISYLTQISDLTTELDLVIVATGSAPRRAIIETLLKHSTVKNFVLEKFLFQKLSDYTAVESLLKEKELLSKTWVNCPRRMFDYYKELKQHNCFNKPCEMEVRGNGWGLACNAVHFVDVFALLTGETEWTFEVEPNSKIVDSKRAGYIEIVGAVIGKSKNGYSIKLIDRPDIDVPIITTFKSANGTEIILDEVNSHIIIGDTTKDINIRYQSGLTGEVAEQILNENYSDLTPYQESAKLHTAFLEAVVEFYNTQTNSKGDNCPIT